MTNPNYKPPIAFWKYDRLCDRIDEMVDRHGSHDQIASAEPILTPLTARFRQQYGGVDRKEREARVLVKVARTEVTALASVMRSWVPVLGLHVGDYDLTPVARANVPDDLVIQGRRLLERLFGTAEDGDPTFPGARQAIGEIEPQVARADAALRSAQDALFELQQRRQELRQTTYELNQALVSFRRIMRAVFGPKSREYRLLHAGSGRRNEPAEEELPEALNAPVANDSPEPETAEPEDTDAA